MNSIRSNRGFFLLVLLYLIAGLVINLAYTQKELFFLVNSFSYRVTDPLMYYYTNVGDGLFAIAVIVVLAFIKLKYAIAGLVAYALQGGIVQGMKHVVFPAYNRPYKVWGETDIINLLEGFEPHIHNSMPSGHTATAFCLFTLLALISKNKYWGPVFFLAAFLVGYSRVYLAQHMVLDIFVGSLIGILTAVPVYWYFFSQRRKFNRQDHWINKPLQEAFKKKAGRLNN